MPRDFYATVAQILPVLLLAFVWDSGYLARLHGERRSHRRADPVNGVQFWTKRRVRRYALTVTTGILLDLGLCALVLAGAVPDHVVVRVLVLGGLGLALVTLLTRISVDIIAATQDAATPEAVPLEARAAPVVLPVVTPAVAGETRDEPL
ncbi:hypothetical protein MF672_034405 [Actinomadura sp. ATCC 31491]|uniref:Uncharacterized protein n=1 Tax=Actinomadura luzonensis TaxID=2805427 RepID=A0ABT0G2Y4_9ACTN|nr:hypothetical protein [Actinomadura luzonensis]MCK2218849.1 hypothetical protein [Actinomadura luzonensis]